MLIAPPKKTPELEIGDELWELQMSVSDPEIGVSQPIEGFWELPSF